MIKFMKLLANENFPLARILYFRSKGFDINSIGIDNPVDGITSNALNLI